MLLPKAANTVQCFNLDACVTFSVGLTWLRSVLGKPRSRGAKLGNTHQDTLQTARWQATPASLLCRLERYTRRALAGLAQPRACARRREEALCGTQRRRLACRLLHRQHVVEVDGCRQAELAQQRGVHGGVGVVAIRAVRVRGGGDLHERPGSRCLGFGSTWHRSGAPVPCAPCGVMQRIVALHSGTPAGAPLAPRDASCRQNGGRQAGAARTASYAPRAGQRGTVRISRITPNASACVNHLPRASARSALASHGADANSTPLTMPSRLQPSRCRVETAARSAGSTRVASLALLQIALSGNSRRHNDEGVCGPGGRARARFIARPFLSTVTFSSEFSTSQSQSGGVTMG
jgi:hypothetical protein